MLKLLHTRIKKIIKWKWLPPFCHFTNCKYCWCSDMCYCDELKLKDYNIKQFLIDKWVHGQCRRLCNRCVYSCYCLEEYRK